MPRPTSAIQRPDLGAIAYEYLVNASQNGFIGLELMPLFPVDEVSADYPIIPIEALLKLKPSIKRAPRAGYPRGDYKFETGTYKCHEYGWEEPVDEVEAKLYARFFDAEQVATMRAMDTLLRHQEKRMADALFNTANFANSAVSVRWSTPATATPRADVKVAKAAMRAASGLEPNVMAMSKKVFENILICADIKDYLKYTAPHLMEAFEVQKAIVAQYLGVNKIVVGNALYDSAKKNKAFNLVDIWDDNYVLLAKVSNGGKDLKDPCLGRSFLWTKDSPQNVITESYREEQTRSDIYRVRHYIDDDAFVFTGAGYILSNITAP